MSQRPLSVPRRFLDAVDRHDLIREGCAVLVAVSGGADSVALLDLMRLAARQRHWRLTAFHLNHRLRDKSEQDELFVRELTSVWGIPLDARKANVALYARKHGLSLEEAGREVRYARMEKTARVFACERVALGHNADDNLETVILNLSRGAGLRGLAGIPIRRGRFVRPLLDIGRHELRQYLRGRSIPWMEDETNADLRFRRNLVRDRVTPVLRQLNPEVAGNVRRMSDVLVAEDAELERQASRGVGGAVTARGRRTLIDTVKLGQYNDCLKRRILRLLVPELDAAGTERLLEFVAGGRTGRLDLTSGVRARATERSIELTRSKGNS